MIEITLIKSYDDISPSLWNETLSNSDSSNLFLTWEWLSTWWRHFGTERKPLLLLGREDKHLSAIAPLMISTHRARFIALNLIQFMGTGLSDYSNLILAGNKRRMLNSIFDFLDEQKVKWDMMDLRNIPSDTGTVQLLESIANERGHATITRESAVQRIDLSDTWEAHFRKLSPNMRKQLLQNQRHAEREYSVGFRCVKDPSRSIGTFLETYRGWLAERHKQSALFDIPINDVGEFLADFTHRFAEKGWIHLSFMTFDQNPVSSFFGFIYDKSYYVYMTSWDRKYAYFGVGNLHLMNITRHCIELGLKELDLLRGDERYKTRWNPVRTSNVRVMVMRKTLKGRLCHSFLKATEQKRLASILEILGIGRSTGL